MKKKHDRVTVTTKEARSGETSGHVRAILIVGTIIAVVGLLVAAVIWTPG
jgi:hypothetical protein